MAKKYIPEDMIPLEALKAERAGCLFAEQCDMGSRYERQLAAALKTVLEWIGTPEYKKRLECCRFTNIPEASKILINAINHYGADAQIAKAVEELAELQQALCKYLCTRSESVRDNIIEEIADVEIMLQQIKMIFNINQSEVENVKDFKLSRLAERIAADTSGATAEKIAGVAILE